MDHSSLSISFEELVKRHRTSAAYYVLWLNGRSFHCSRVTFQRHRKILLAYGLDIAIPNPSPPPRDNVQPIQRVIEAVPVSDADIAAYFGDKLVKLIV